jgi:hypothetical protein
MNRTNGTFDPYCSSTTLKFRGGVEHHGLEPEQYCSAKGRTRWMSNNRHGHNVRSQPRDVCGRDLESSLSSSRIRKTVWAKCEWTAPERRRNFALVFERERVIGEA